jgi:hypothetical protein
MESSVADRDFYPSRIPDLGSRIHQQQKRGGKIFCLTFFGSQQIHEINFFFFLKRNGKKSEPIDEEL